uniref:Uncharacterized protein n=1 Tax=Anopheles coluzzii TaxID=1518534 RepID=A0A8W7PFY8_ANOCL
MREMFSMLQQGQSGKRWKENTLQEMVRMSGFYRNCRREVNPISASRLLPPMSSQTVGPIASRVAPLHASSLQIEQDSILTPRCSFALPYAIWHGSVLPPSSWQPRWCLFEDISVPEWNLPLEATIFWHTIGTVISVPPKYSMRVRSASQLPVVAAILLGVHVCAVENGKGGKQKSGVMDAVCALR